MVLGWALRLTAGQDLPIQEEDLCCAAQMDLGDSFVRVDEEVKPVVLRDVEGEGFDVQNAFFMLLGHPLVLIAVKMTLAVGSA